MEKDCQEEKGSSIDKKEGSIGEKVDNIKEKNGYGGVEDDYYNETSRARRMTRRSKGCF